MHSSTTITKIINARIAAINMRTPPFRPRARSYNNSIEKICRDPGVSKYLTTYMHVPSRQSWANAQQPILGALRRCATGRCGLWAKPRSAIRFRDFAGVINGALRERRQRPILDRDKSDRRRRRQRVDWQNIDAQSLGAKPHDGGGNETKPTPRVDQTHEKMERHRRYAGQRNFQATLPKNFVLQRPRQTAR
jgi:hypothetical protein